MVCLCLNTLISIAEVSNHLFVRQVDLLSILLIVKFYKGTVFMHLPCVHVDWIVLNKLLFAGTHDVF